MLISGPQCYAPFSVQTPLSASRDRQRFAVIAFVESGSDLPGRAILKLCTSPAERCIAYCPSPQSNARTRKKNATCSAGLPRRVITSFSITAGSSETSASAQIFNCACEAWSIRKRSALPSDIYRWLPPRLANPTVVAPSTRRKPLARDAAGCKASRLDPWPLHKTNLFQQ